MQGDDDWFVTAGGRKVFVTAPDPAQISIDDIAHALAQLCRFGGHLSEFYCVADHCVTVMHEVPDWLRVPALLHDASEAYLQDVIRPLKRLLPEYRNLEARWEAAIARAFGIDPALFHHPEIKQADMRALVTERREFLAVSAHTFGDWIEDEIAVEPFSYRLHPSVPAASRLRFLKAWEFANANALGGGQ